jgi:2-desacetyl-2-hydroxyethyl bacteriochlorophyllide A dehydrogenase
MRAVQLVAAEQLHVADVPEPTPREGEVVLEVAGCGVCGTDLHTVSGGNPLVRFPAVPGHEFGGTVVTLGAGVTWLAVGDRVVVDPSRSCEHCEHCLGGRPNLCPDKGGHGSRFPGGFAEQVAVRATSCVRVPASMPWEVALLAEPLACVLHGVDRLGAATGQDAVVWGAGPIGLLTAVVLRHKGTDVHVVERSEARRDAAAALGLAVVADAAALPGSDAAVVVDATGVPAAIEEGFGRLRRGGTLLMMGVASPGSAVSLDPHRINWHELTIVGSMAVQSTFERAVRLLDRIGDQVRPLVTHDVPLESFPDALDLVRSQGALKVLVRPDRPR